MKQIVKRSTYKFYNNSCKTLHTNITLTHFIFCKTHQSHARNQKLFPESRSERVNTKISLQNISLNKRALCSLPMESFWQCTTWPMEIRQARVSYHSGQRPTKVLECSNCHNTGVRRWWLPQHRCQSAMTVTAQVSECHDCHNTGVEVQLLSQHGCQSMVTPTMSRHRCWSVMSVTTQVLRCSYCHNTGVRVWWLSHRHDTGVGVPCLSKHWCRGAVTITTQVSESCDCHSTVVKVWWLSQHRCWSAVTVTLPILGGGDCHNKGVKVRWL